MACTISNNMLYLVGMLCLDIQREILNRKVELECREHFTNKVVALLKTRTNDKLKQQAEGAAQAASTIMIRQQRTFLEAHDVL